LGGAFPKQGGITTKEGKWGSKQNWVMAITILSLSTKEQDLFVKKDGKFDP